MSERSANGWLLAFVLLTILGVAQSAAASSPRHFQVRYTATLPAVPAGAKIIRVWMPYPESDPWQTIANVAVDAPYGHSVRREAEYGSAILCLEGAPPTA